MVCGFTGHRPEKLPWGTREDAPECVELKTRMEQAIRETAKEGFDTFLCGMARGCDLYFAEAVVKLKGEGLPLRLEAWLPCPEQADRWPSEDRRRYEKLLLECDGVYILEPRYSEGCMLRRNRAMVARCHRLISVWDGSRGGTGAAVRYGRIHGLEITSLWS